MTRESGNAIQVKNVGKTFRMYASPSARLKELMFFGRRKLHREFTALSGVSFDVPKGEAVGIIGVNGSGKSTLLQMICSVMQPTTGTVAANGRISALLELGAGFNPEFSGRENVYMNGSLHGIDRAELERRMPSIEAFAEIGDFIDQPVKTYSSGMFLRLAFSVAINVDPEILVIDEALAVGDQYFQHKCMNALRRMQDAGVTVLFVSHDADSVKALCHRALWLDDGKVRALGPAKDVVDRYHQFNRDRVNATLSGDAKPAALTAAGARSGTGDLHILHVSLTDAQGCSPEAFPFNSLVRLDIRLRANRHVESCFVAYHVRDRLGIEIAGSDTAVEEFRIPPLRAGQEFSLRFEFRLPFKEGAYSVLALATIPTDDSGDPARLQFADWIDSACVFAVRRREGPRVWSRVLLPSAVVPLEKTDVAAG